MLVVYEIVTWASLLIPYFITVGHYVPLLLAGIVFIAYWFAFTHIPAFCYVHAAIMVWSVYESFMYFPIWTFFICVGLTVFFIWQIVSDLIHGSRPF